MPWLTSTLFKQGPDEPLTRIPKFNDGPAKVRFRHIIHAYNDAAAPENTAILPITFDSVERARRFAAPDTFVVCAAVTFPEDLDLIPAGVVRATPLHRDVTEIARFAVPRRLPLLFDVLHNGVSALDPDAATGSRADEVEFVILTNSDIHLQPHFYSVMTALIAQGYDVITANRRTIDVDRQQRSPSPLYLAERGSDHPGLDCLVFPLRMMNEFLPSACCCGAGHVMRSLLFNLVAHAHRFLMLTHAQMTYHLGDDRHWTDPRFADYLEFNIRQAQAVIAGLAKNSAAAARLAEFIAVHELPVFGAALPQVMPP